MADYKDLEVRIGRDEVSLRVGDSDYRNRPNFNASTLRRMEQLRQRAPSEYGAALFEAAFREKAKEGYRRAIVESQTDLTTRWRLRLNIDENAAGLHGLWWECLADGSPPAARSRITPLSRYLPLPATRGPVREPRLRVLVVISNPKDLGKGKWQYLPRLHDDQERAVIEASLSGLDDRIEYEFHPPPASLESIRRRLRNESFHVLHVVGHGFRDQAGHGGLMLEGDEDRLANPIMERKLSEMVADLYELQLIVLAACHSAERSEQGAFIGLAPSMVRAGVPAVVAMQDRVASETAHKFAKHFYQALGRPGERGMVDAAVNEARDEIYYQTASDDVWDWSMPVVFMRGNGCLFEPASGADSDWGSTDSRPVVAAPRSRSVSSVSATEPRSASNVTSLFRKDHPEPRIGERVEETPRQRRMRMVGTDARQVDLYIFWFEVPGIDDSMGLMEKIMALVSYIEEEPDRDDRLVEMYRRMQAQDKSQGGSQEGIA